MNALEFSLKKQLSRKKRGQIKKGGGNHNETKAKEIIN